VNTLRLFFALQPTAAQCADLVEATTALAAQLGGRPNPPDNLHATVCFVGAVPEEKLDALRTVAASVRGVQGTLCFDALEYWETPRILCATARETAESLPARDLGIALGAAAVGAGFSPDIKPFRAHLTLARKVRAEVAASLDWPQPLAETLLVRADRFVLMESRKGEAGSVYSVVDSWPLYR
jgi:2'-5' RNA ligase